MKSIVPEPHIEVLLTGGFDLELDDSYTDRQRYILRSNGKYIRALACGHLQPASPTHTHFIEVTQGRAEPTSFIEEAWLKLIDDYPVILGDDCGEARPEHSSTDSAATPQQR